MNDSVFTRRPLLQRTPPRRQSSCPDLMGGIANPSLKRPRLSDEDDSASVSSLAGPKKCFTEKIYSEICKVKDELTNGNDELAKEDIVKALSKVLLLMQDGPCCCKTIKKVTSFTSGTQTCTDKQLQDDIKKMVIFENVAKLTSESTETEILDIVGLEWPKSAFRCTTTQRRSFVTSQNARLLIADTKIFATSPLAKSLTLQFPALQNLILKNPAAGKLALVEGSDSLLLEGDDEVGESQKRRLIIGFVNSEEIESETIQIMLKARAKFAELHINRATMFVVGDLVEERLRRIAECIFASSSTLIEICTHRKSGDKPKVGQKYEKSKHQTILIKSSGENGGTFASVVAKMKKDISPEDVGVSIKKISKTKEGDARIFLKERSAGARQKLVTEIESKTSAKVTVEDRKLSLFISGFDEFASTEDIKESILRELNLENAEISISEIRKSPSGLNSVTALMSKALALKLVGLNLIRIGWSKARVREKIIPDYCRTCQHFGHRTITCKKAPVVNELCRRCGEPGHKAAGCDNDLKCYVCDNFGHRADSMACPVFRAAVQDARKQKTPTGPVSPINLDGN